MSTPKQEMLKQELRALKAKEVAAECKARAAADYPRFHMFVECNGEAEWLEFVEDFTTERAFELMDSVSEVWADHAAEARSGE